MKNEVIYGLGVTPKSTTILNFCNLNNNHIKKIFDNSKTKINKFTPLTNIPIIDSKRFFKTKIKYCILFAWNHHGKILSKIKNSKNIQWLTHIDKNHFGKYKKYFL